MTESVSLLIIDDNPHLTESYRDFFEEAGFRVTVADSGDKGVTTAKRLQPDVIFLDLMLPGKNGIEVLRELRQDENLKSTPIAVITALLDDSQKRLCLQEGANIYVEKLESDPEDLLKKVKQLLKQSSK